MTRGWSRLSLGGIRELSRRVRGRAPAWSYTPLSALGGFAFAAVAYVIGSSIYWWELRLSGSPVPRRPVWTLLLRAPVDHGLTLFLWLCTTTLLAVSIAYLLERQRRQAERLEALRVTDGLTSIYNDRYFIRALHQEIARTRRSRQGFSLVLLDLDDFRKYNETHGQLAGDEVLRRAAQILKGSVRETDLVARHGGGEFVVLALGADTTGAVVLAEKLRAHLAEALPVTVSIGVATFGEAGRSVSQLIDAAAVAMDRAKRTGKNRVCAG